MRLEISRFPLRTMPSYSSEKIGLEIDNISPKNRPAAKTDIKKGGVIKSINGKPIGDIYEYIDRLDYIKPGMTILVFIEGKNQEKTIKMAF